MQLRLEQFNDNTTGIRDSIASLRSCRVNEIPNEAHILRRVLHTHRGDTLLRRNQAALDRRAEMVARAEEVLVESDARVARAANTAVSAAQQHLTAGGTAKSLLEAMKRA
ncbi:MAG: hypothetical protein EOP83_04430 [Verrucomicrobiaceae bacterium]|nr:MAG: hypothetical protein EOP83_04430 [Verrucomicrobiaceae bacterium]